MRPILVERELHHLRRQAAAAYLELELRPLLRALGRHVARADRDAERGAHGAASHFPALLALVEHGVAVAREAALRRGEADELSRHAALLLCYEGLASHEVAL